MNAKFVLLLLLKIDDISCLSHFHALALFFPRVIIVDIYVCYVIGVGSEFKRFFRLNEKWNEYLKLFSYCFDAIKIVSWRV